jgi:hypothetical protein
MASPGLKVNVKVEPAAGDFVCFLGKNKQISSYGVLAQKLTAIATCGTYVVPSSDPTEIDGTLQIIGRQELHVAWLRLNNQDPSSPYTAQLPRETLETIYALRISNPRRLQDEITKLETKFIDSMNVAAEAVLAAKQAKRQAAKAKPKQTRKKVKQIQRVPIVKWNVGTHVAAYFANAELYKGASGLP